MLISVMLTQALKLRLGSFNKGNDMYLIIDEQHRIYRTNKLTKYVKKQTKKGNLSVINIKDMIGMNIDGTWSEIQKWDGSYTVSLLRI